MTEREGIYKSIHYQRGCLKYKLLQKAFDPCLVNENFEWPQKFKFKCHCITSFLVDWKLPLSSNINFVYFYCHARGKIRWRILKKINIDWSNFFFKKKAVFNVIHITKNYYSENVIQKKWHVLFFYTNTKFKTIKTIELLNIIMFRCKIAHIIKYESYDIMNYILGINIPMQHIRNIFCII